MEQIGSIIMDLLQNFSAYIVPSFIFGSLMGCLFWHICKNGMKSTVFIYLMELKHNSHLIYQLLFFIYVYFIFDRTLFSRRFGWSNGLGNIMGGWLLLDSKTGEITFEAIENFAFFIPYILLFFLSFYKEKTARMVLKNSLCIGFFTSLLIEMGQMVFKIGEFQISDLTYNTLGTLVGGLIYIIGMKIKKNYVKQKDIKEERNL